MLYIYVLKQNNKFKILYTERKKTEESVGEIMAPNYDQINPKLQDTKLMFSLPLFLDLQHWPEHWSEHYLGCHSWPLILRSAVLMLLFLVHNSFVWFVLLSLLIIIII